MSTTGMVMTVTDELLAELDLSVRAVWHDDDAAVVAVDALTAELRRLRAENAELARDAGRYRWLQKASPYMHKKIRDLAITDGGDVFYFHKDKYDAAIDTAMATQ